MTVARWLEARGAHHDVVAWAEPFGGSWERAWAECPRGDWLLGVAAKAGVARAAIVRAACACATLGLDQVPDAETRAQEALDAAARWLDGEDDPAARARARVAAEAAADEAPDPAAQAAAMAARAALGAVDEPAEAASAAAFVAQAAMLDVADCAVMSALGYAQATCAERVRAHIPLEALAGSLEPA